MTDISSTKDIIRRVTFGIPKGTKNTISIAFSVDILISNDNIISDEHKAKNVLK